MKCLCNRKKGDIRQTTLWLKMMFTEYYIFSCHLNGERSRHKAVDPLFSLFHGHICLPGFCINDVKNVQHRILPHN